ncbi:hypothetical protein LOT_0979 [Lentilactobacillus otakiensis DSM 19908 = JCM 15040]|uniref:Uncharacterized protein n=1 Tax=Lentilactobacillus otakiensis DSM 19908 = JCM 15040 TaxID=1423780 RepID=S4NKK1_9LACO|nr:hypothetical protein LOT_0979 [Lentilactobacillus otakiensis DSM 19908 = JCM 15040]
MPGFCWLGIASHSESVVEADEIGDYNTFVFQDYRLEIKATMAGGTKPAKSHHSIIVHFKNIWTQKNRSIAISD